MRKMKRKIIAFCLIFVIVLALPAVDLNANGCHWWCVNSGLFFEEKQYGWQ